MAKKCKIILNFTGNHATHNDMNLKFQEGGNRSQGDLSIFV